MNVRDALAASLAGRALTREQARETFAAALDESVDPITLGGLLCSLAQRGETVDEITGAAEALRAAAVPFEGAGDAIDTCGTGGDGLDMFNVSTAAAIVACAAGARVVKHGNRSVSSKCGSADLLEAAGVPLELEPSAAREVLDEVGITFLFAPKYHPAMRFAAPVRRALGVRTIFNLLGPLCNPARVRRQLLGVADSRRAAQFAAVLEGLGHERGFVVHGAGGADELTLAGTNSLTPIGRTPHVAFDASELGLRRAHNDALAGGDATRNLAILHGIPRRRGRAARRRGRSQCRSRARRGRGRGRGDGRRRSGARGARFGCRAAQARAVGTRRWSAGGRGRVSTGTRLDPILVDVRRRAAERRVHQSLEALRASAAPDPTRRARFVDALRGAQLGIIAECKRRSPSVGELSSETDLAARARAYATGGASALSILTEADHFHGSPDDLERVASTGLPRLRKDFVLDEGMVLESLAMGADAVLLLAVCLDDAELAHLRAVAGEVGLAVLLEVHDERELERGLAVRPDCLGVNARDLTTFEVDLATVERLLPVIPREFVRVAESGLRELTDVQRVQAAGADAVLVGEALMRAADPAATLREWRSALGEVPRG